MSQLLYILKKELVNNALITVLSYFLNTSNDNELYDASYAIYHKVKLIKKNFTKNKFI